MDGHEFYRSKSAIDASDEFVHSCAEILVLFNVLSRGNCKLNEDNLERDLYGAQARFEGLRVPFRSILDAALRRAREHAVFVGHP